MDITDFIRKYGVACGGNWTAMVMSAIEEGAPDLYASLEDRTYEFVELFDLLDKYLREE